MSYDREVVSLLQDILSTLKDIQKDKKVDTRLSDMLKKYPVGGFETDCTDFPELMPEFKQAEKPCRNCGGKGFIMDAGWKYKCRFCQGE